MIKQIKGLRKEPETPCKDFWRTMIIGAWMALVIFVVSTGVGIWLMR